MHFCIAIALIFISAISFAVAKSADSLNFTEFVAEVSKVINESATYVLPTNNDQYFESQDENEEKATDFGTYDFIIVGAGTAGGVLANRLTETKYSVLVIEAGKEDPAISKVLGLCLDLVNTEYNWGYNTTVQKNACLGVINQQCLHPRGKALGGTSTINFGFYSRGNKADYNSWVKLGNPGWSYDEVLPYFKKAETADFTVDIDKAYHGFQGPAHVGIVEDQPILTKELLNSFKQVGIKEGDYNGANQYVTSRTQMFLDGPVRSTTAHSYILPALNRANLKLTLESLTTKILLSKNLKVTGVEFWKNGKKCKASARNEVILSAGAINTPQLLMLSGIGPKDELEKHGIDVLVNSNAVGKNFKDHMWYFGLVFRTNVTAPYTDDLVENLGLWTKNKRPLVPSPGFQTVAYYGVGNKTESESPPDIEIIIIGPPAAVPELAESFGLNDEYAKTFANLNGLTDIIPGVFLLGPKSVGTVTLQSADPKDYPLIDPNFLSNPEDIEIMYQGVQKALELQETPAFKNLGARLVRDSSPSCDSLYEKFSKDWWMCDIKHIGYSGYHPLGSTKMGPSKETSVVNENLEVYGVKQLRVVDAGVIPTVVAAHPTAPVIMIAEKIADVIKAKYI